MMALVWNASIRELIVKGYVKRTLCDDCGEHDLLDITVFGRQFLEHHTDPPPLLRVS